MTSWSFVFLSEHHERYYLYLIISVTIGVLLCLIIITGRIIIHKQHDEREDSSKDEPKFHKSSTGETTITKSFSGDNICDLEGGDIDLSTPMGVVNLPVKNEVIVMRFGVPADVYRYKCHSFILVGWHSVPNTPNILGSKRLTLVHQALNFLQSSLLVLPVDKLKVYSETQGLWPYWNVIKLSYLT